MKWTNKNQDNQLIWAEQVSVKNSGMYSTLAIAGGSGWENYGNYTLEVNDGFEIKSVVFLFTSWLLEFFPMWIN